MWFDAARSFCGNLAGFRFLCEARAYNIKQKIFRRIDLKHCVPVSMIAATLICCTIPPYRNESVSIQRSNHCSSLERHPNSLRQSKKQPRLVLLLHYLLEHGISSTQ